MKLSGKLKEFRNIRSSQRFYPLVDGKVEVKVTGKELYSDVNAALPSPDIIEYLYDAASHTLPTDRLRIVFDDEIDIKEATETYKDYIAMDIRKSMSKLRLNTLQTLSLLAFGTIVLALSYFLGDTSTRLIAETVNIVGCFSVWEAADLFLLARTEKRMQLLTYIKLYESEWTSRDIS